MTRRLLGAFTSLALLAGPAWAQAPNPATPAPLPPQPAQATGAPVTTAMSALLAEGYDIRAVTVLSDQVRREIYRAPDVAPQVMVTLQKGQSIAVCVAAVVNWMNQAQATRDNKTLCHRD